MVHIYPSGRVLLSAEGLEVVAHRSGHADFKVVFAFLEVIGDVVYSTTKILYASRLPVDKHFGNTFHEVQDCTLVCPGLRLALVAAGWDLDSGGVLGPFPSLLLFSACCC